MDQKIQSNNEFLTLPYQYQIAGIVIMAVTILLSICTNYFNIHIITLSSLLTSGFVIGLSMFSLAKKKIERTEFQNIRQRSIFGAVVFTIIYTIITPFVSDMLGTTHVVSGVETIIGCLIMYNIFFYIQQFNKTDISSLD